MIEFDNLEKLKTVYEKEIDEYVSGLIKKYSAVGGLCALSDYNQKPYETDNAYLWRICDAIEDAIDEYLLSHDDYENNENYVVDGADFPKPDTYNAEDYSRIVNILENYDAAAEVKFDNALTKLNLPSSEDAMIYELMPYLLKKQLTEEQLILVIETILKVIPKPEPKTKPKTKSKKSKFNSL
ncbi:hypothetical protein AGMMS49975_20320 [Clostridia bacterium]|nr:hypothetical protein AGMMS49975_20320 [Clostridia bacterium]